MKNCDVDGCWDEVEYLDDMGNEICEDHMEEDIEDSGSCREDFERIKK